LELFLGGAVDFDVAGCELQIARVFRSLGDARRAAEAIGRRQVLVVSWRTDAKALAPYQSRRLQAVMVQAPPPEATRKRFTLAIFDSRNGAHELPGVDDEARP
jgi:hypothetical protein